ncbi:MAG: hypothetical protein GX886_15230, partial [Comamonadaceae bacterium]|nr:hypothetical protein [Comamonadaceae bacterium]
MTAPYRVALLGFNAFERNILTSHLRLAERRMPSYELHKILAEADFVVADADHAPSVQLVLVTDRLADAVFVGARAPEEAGACLARPLEPLQVLRALDALVAAGAAPAKGVAGDKVRTEILPHRAGRAAAPPAPDDELPLPPLELVLRASVGAASAAPPVAAPARDLPAQDATARAAPPARVPPVDRPLVDSPPQAMPPGAAPPTASPSASAPSPAAQPSLP